MDSKFGWSLPPGCGRLPSDEPDLPCQVCGKDPSGGTYGCQCPECEICGEAGNPKCYPNHFSPTPWHVLVPNNRTRASLHDANGKTIAEEIDVEVAFWIRDRINDARP